MFRQSDYLGRKVALLTQHGKERVIAPVLDPGLGCVIESASATRISISMRQRMAYGAVAGCHRGIFVSAGRASRAGFAGGHVLGFGLDVLLAILRASALGGIKIVTILSPVSCVPCYGPLIAAIHREAGQDTDCYDAAYAVGGDNCRFYIKLTLLFHCLVDRLLLWNCPPCAN